MSGEKQELSRYVEQLLEKEPEPELTAVTLCLDRTNNLGSFGYKLQRQTLPQGSVITCFQVDRCYWNYADSLFSWTYTFNKFLARVLGLSKREMLQFRFYPECWFRFSFRINSQLLPLASPQIEGTCLVLNKRREEFRAGGSKKESILFFYSHFDTNFDRMFTDFIFVEIQPEEFRQSVAQMSFSVCVCTYALETSELLGQSEERILYGYDAIFLIETKQSAIYAIPWLQNDIEDVEAYCRDVFSLEADAAGETGTVLVAASETCFDVEININCLDQLGYWEPETFVLGCGFYEFDDEYY